MPQKKKEKSQEVLYELVPLDSKKEEIWLGGNENKHRFCFKSKRWGLGETDAVVVVISEAISRLDIDAFKKLLGVQYKNLGKECPPLIVSPLEFKFLRVVKVDEEDKPEDKKIPKDSF